MIRIIKLTLCFIIFCNSIKGNCCDGSTSIPTSRLENNLEEKHPIDKLQDERHENLVKKFDEFREEMGENLKIENASIQTCLKLFEELATQFNEFRNETRMRLNEVKIKYEELSHKLIEKTKDSVAKTVLNTTKRDSISKDLFNESNQCGGHEYWGCQSGMIQCQDLCEYKGYKGLCTADCLYKCYCLEGFKRNGTNGECIPEDQCPETIDMCQVTEWTEFTPCSATCGNGTRTRTRNYIHGLKAQQFGCLAQLIEREICTGVETQCPDENKIDPECSVTEWSEWTPCTVTCGKGVKIRKRLFINSWESRSACSIDLIQRTSCDAEIDCKVDMNKAKETCMQNKEVGQCKAYFPRYYYDVAKGMCYQFIYGGCGGNKNNFERYKDCKRMCEDMLQSQLEKYLCEQNQFRCRDGTCIDIRNHCNQKYDCPDYSDEYDCTVPFDDLVTLSSDNVSNGVSSINEQEPIQNLTLANCSEHEQWGCKSGMKECQDLCEYKGYDGSCTKNCLLGCWCKPGYLRISKNGQCVPKNECP